MGVGSSRQWEEKKALKAIGREKAMDECLDNTNKGKIVKGCGREKQGSGSGRLLRIVGRGKRRGQRGENEGIGRLLEVEGVEGI